MSSWIESTFGTKMSPTILFIIVLLAIILFIAGLVHLLIRFLFKQPSPNPPETRIVQRQLQHLFHLHDSGLDQSLIDTLPVFLYKDIVALNFKHRVYNRPESFDCAVCLCEFSEQDKLRLLPLCSHAFHIDCIDTWLLSNSTCPLCRGVILSSEGSTNNPCFYFDGVEIGSSRNHQEYGEVSSVLADQKRVFSVRLGKFKNSTNIVVGDDDDGCLSLESGEIGETSRGQNGDLTCDARRCFSMGSFQYVVADSELQVALCESGNVRGGQSCHFTCEEGEGKKIKVGESFSVSKIWLWSKRSSSRLQTSLV